MLEVHDITCRYGSVTALRDASLEIHEGEVVAIIGSNGAGKSTLMKALAGLLPPVSGRIVLRGQELQGASPDEIVAAGLCLVAEGRRVFPGLSVEDNLLLGGYVDRKKPEELRERRQRMYEIFPALGDRPKLLADKLSGGQQQMLAIAQGLMAEPAILLLDEPSLGLAPSIVTTVFDTIRELSATGITIVLVEQMVRQALDLADRGYVLQTGRIVASGTSDELARDERVREAYLGLVEA